MKGKILLSTAILALVSCSVVAEDDIFLGEDQKPGLVNMTNGDDMFYWLFRSRGNPSTDPLVMWLTGGPGCSSGIAVFYENGPFQINEDLSLRVNPYSWNNASNLVFVDSPIGTGFSKCSSITHLDTNEEQVAENIERLIRGLIEQNPEFQGREFFITGESYAGHYIPAIAYYLTYNITTPLPVTFKGVAIGNGWVDPLVQYP